MDIKSAFHRVLTGKDKRGVNVRLLKKVERYIRRHPERYDQNSWFKHDRERDNFTAPEVIGIVRGHVCKTTACVAGNALVLSGKIGEFTAEQLWYDPITDEKKMKKLVRWAEGGTAVLGLNEKVADWLFSSSRAEGSILDVLACLRNGGTLDEMQDVEYEYWQQKYEAERLADFS